MNILVYLWMNMNHDYPPDLDWSDHIKINTKMSIKTKPLICLYTSIKFISDTHWDYSYLIQVLKIDMNLDSIMITVNNTCSMSIGIMACWSLQLSIWIWFYINSAVTIFVLRCVVSILALALVIPSLLHILWWDSQFSIFFKPFGISCIMVWIVNVIRCKLKSKASFRLSIVVDML